MLFESSSDPDMLKLLYNEMYKKTRNKTRKLGKIHKLTVKIFKKIEKKKFSVILQILDKAKI